MIQACELRIGNWCILPNSNGEMKQVDFINKETDFWLPIPLTPELLEKCGFIRIEKYNFGYPVFYFNKHTCLKTNNSGNCEYLFMEDGCRIPCKYLHQLQNLYFALAGAELQVNL